MAQQSSHGIRNPTREEMKQVVDIINEEGWNTHLEILYDIYDHQPKSSQVVVDDKGEVLSHCCFVLLDEKNALATGFITRKGHRGRGLGKLVWDACKKEAAGINLFINSIIPVVHVYEKQGATLSTPAFEMCEIFVQVKKQFNGTFMKKIEDCEVIVKNYKPEMFPRLDEYDASYHCIKRSHFLETHLGKCLNVRVAYNASGAICGYGCIRENYQGFTLAPLYAENTTTAKKLLHSLLENVSDGSTLKIFICDGNAEGVREVMRHVGYEAKPYDPGHHAKRLFTISDSPVTSVHRVYCTMNFQYCLI